MNEMLTNATANADTDIKSVKTTTSTFNGITLWSFLKFVVNFMIILVIMLSVVNKFRNSTTGKSFTASIVSMYWKREIVIDRVSLGKDRKWIYDDTLVTSGDKSTPIFDHEDASKYNEVEVKMLGNKRKWAPVDTFYVVLDNGNTYEMSRDDWNYYNCKDTINAKATRSNGIVVSGKVE